MNNKTKSRLGMGLTAFGGAIPIIILIGYSAINFKIAITLLIINQLLTIVGMELLSLGLDMENKDLRKQIKEINKEGSKCPYNNDIECVSGAFCDGCKHEFDDVRKSQ